MICFFAFVIIYQTVFAMIKVLQIALERRQITNQKYKVMLTSSITVGSVSAALLPVGYTIFY
ncbi:hypothetical protein [Bacillus sp. BHET2]|uniref:hypothetical protein n=1 Tax=Bacillus sp. BHET2 TaxID=2583818 RepID=UPI001486966B|nr:hypothetical protein [Bacillus sp. BHET2]